MSIAEIVSELEFIGKSRADIAGYDDRYIAFVLGRKRDQHGRLVKTADLPPGVEVDSDGMRVVSKPQSFGSMFMQVKRRHGLDRDRAMEQWEKYLGDNPKLRKLGMDE